MKKKLLTACVLLCTLTLASAQNWKPNKTITLIVPWGAGGASDQVGRLLVSEMEKELGGRRIAVVNQPGASGATGHQTVWDSPHDGYTWAANADGSVVGYQAQELLKMSHRDWRSYLAVFTPAVICVNPNSPIQNLQDLINACKTRDVKIASAGVGAGGHIAAETFAKYAGVKYTHIPYGGGGPAITATVSGETEVVMQLINEEVDMIRAKRLRPIAVMNTTVLKVSGVSDIPSVNTVVKNMPPVGFNFGLFIPRDIPENVVKTIDKAFEKAATSKTLRDYSEQKGTIPVALYGTEADKSMEDSASAIAWLLYDSGVAKINPDTLRIKKK